jgi:hypothetical protein
MNEKIASKFTKVVLGQSDMPMGLTDAFKKQVNFKGNFSGEVDDSMNDDFSDFESGSIAAPNYEEISPLISLQPKSPITPRLDASQRLDASHI